jgi:hypothetical protein
VTVLGLHGAVRRLGAAGDRHLLRMRSTELEHGEEAVAVDPTEVDDVVVGAALAATGHREAMAEHAGAIAVVEGTEALGRRELFLEQLLAEIEELELLVSEPGDRVAELEVLAWLVEVAAAVVAMTMMARAAGAHHQA